MHKLLLAVALAATGATAQAVTVTLAPLADATLYEDPIGLVANGGGNYLFAGLTIGAGARRSVITFDVARQVPAGARIIGAQLDMTVSRSNYLLPLDVTLHRVTASWNEGPSVATFEEGSGTLALPGDVTWIDREKGVSLWSTPGGDFAAAPSGVSSTPQNGATTWSSTSGMVADVQGWLDNPPGNFGWLLRTDELSVQAVRRFNSRENLNPATRPALQITYLLPGQSATIGAGCGSPAPTLAATGSLTPGGSLVLTVQGGPAGAPAATFLSLGLPVQPAFPLAPGCDLHVDQFAVSTPGFAQLDPLGSMADTLAIPLTPSLSGVEITAQSGVVDGSPLGFALSNGVLTILP